MNESRTATEVLKTLHEARLRGDLAGMCELFAARGTFRIAGATDGKPVSIEADGLTGFAPWLRMMVRVFTVTNYQLLSAVGEPDRAAFLWRADITSRITGISVATELMDLAEVRGGRLVRYHEIYTPR